MQIFGKARTFTLQAVYIALGKFQFFLFLNTFTAENIIKKKEYQYENHDNGCHNPTHGLRFLFQLSLIQTGYFKFFFPCVIFHGQVGQFLADMLRMQAVTHPISHIIIIHGVPGFLQVAIVTRHHQIQLIYRQMQSGSTILQQFLLDVQALAIPALIHINKELFFQKAEHFCRLCR